MKRYEIVLLAAAVFAGLGIRLFFFSGLIASDDLSHCYAAFRLVHPETQDTYIGTLAGSANIRRLGVNLPLGLSMLAFGVHEWSISLVPLVFSLAGILLIYALCRTLAGPGAGMLAAWMWACLPVDIYMATVCLQDNVFATVNAAFFLFITCSEKTEKRRWLWALAAGLALGYLQYVKEVGWMFFGPLGVWAVISSWTRRRIEWRILFVFFGFLLIQAAVGCYYWLNDSDPLSYWKNTLDRLFSVYGSRQPTYPYPEVFVRAFQYLCDKWLLGYAVVAFPLLLAAALCYKRTPLRSFLLLFLGAQTFIWLEATKWMNTTERYTLVLSVPFIVFTTLGLNALLSRLPLHWSRRVMVALSLVILASTAAALRPERQQHGRFRGEVLRRAYAYIEDTAADNDKIYFDISPSVPFYTKRMFETLNGFQQLKGGIGDLAEAHQATCGWVVLSHLEEGHMALRSDAHLSIPDSNWLEVYHPVNRNGRYYARVFKILPEPAPPSLKIVDTHGLPSAPPDVSEFQFDPITFQDDSARFLSRWKRASRDVRLTPENHGLRCDVIGDPDSEDSQYGGLKFDVVGLKALRLKLSLINPENVSNIYVYAYGCDKGQLMRWFWSVPPRQRTTPIPDSLVFVPGQPSGGFRFSGDFPPQDIQTVEVFIRLDPGTNAGFILHQAEAATFLPSAAETSSLPFEAINLQAAPESQRLSTRVGASKNVDLEYLPDGAIRCLAHGNPDSSEHQFGGVMFPVDGLTALRLTTSFIDPQNIVGLWIDCCDEKDRRLARWEWRLSPDHPAPQEPTTHLLVLGKPSALFEYEGPADGADVRIVHVFIRLAPGTDAGFILHSADVVESQSPPDVVDSQSPHDVIEPQSIDDVVEPQ